MTLKIKEDELRRETSNEYLGIIINENMTWGDHISRQNQHIRLLHYVKYINLKKYIYFSFYFFSSMLSFNEI